MSEEKNPVVEEIEKEIEDTKRKASDENFEIEITEEPKQEETAEAKKEENEVDAEEEKKKYGIAVQKKIDRMTKERRLAELETKKLQESNSQLLKRLERLEQENVQRNQKVAQTDFSQRYDLTKRALAKAVEEGDTDAQLKFTEDLADMRATIRVGEMRNTMNAQAQQSQVQNQNAQRQRQPIEEPTPELATKWWRENDWFNKQGYEKESAAARAIDVQLDIEGFDKNSAEYYQNLNSRLQKVFPELISNVDVAQTKSRVKSSNIVTPSTGGSTYKGNRVRMTQDQLRMARELGINDEAGLKKYASEIQKSQRS